MKDPTAMTEQELLDTIRKEFTQAAMHEARTTRAISPVEVKAPREWSGPSEETAWLILGGVTALLTILCLYFVL